MSCLAALTHFHRRYTDAYQACLGEVPSCYPHGRSSPCLLDADSALSETPQAWQLVMRQPSATFDNLAQALELTLHPDINAFYGHIFAGPLQFHSPWGQGELIQPWNEEDFVLLQQNILGHLMMKKRLKQPPTWFIGLIGEQDEMLCVDNNDGSVWREVAGQRPHERLADNLTCFIEQLQPRIAPPQLHDEPDVTVDHPGIFDSLKRMWRNLTGR